MWSYHRLLEKVMKEGEPHEDRTGVGTTSIFGWKWEHWMCEGFPLFTTKKISMRWIAEEVFWWLRGSGNEHELRDKGVHHWAEWATAEMCAKYGRAPGDLGHVYGPLWRDFAASGSQRGGWNDQIATLLDECVSNPQSRRHIVTGWNPNTQRNVELPPCHTMWQLKCSGEHDLSLVLFCRSIDIFLGLPFDVAAYALLLQMLADVLGRRPRKLCLVGGDLHLYNNHRVQAVEQLSREPRELPTLDLAAPAGETPLEQLLDYNWADVTLNGYDPYPKLKGDVAV